MPFDISEIIIPEEELRIIDELCENIDKEENK